MARPLLTATTVRPRRLEPGGWRALAGVVVLGVWLASGRRPGTLAAIRTMHRLRQRPAPSQLLGAALLVGASVAVQIAPARPVRRPRSPSPFSG